MADAIDTLKGLLGNGAENKIKSVIGSLSDGGAAAEASNAPDIPDAGAGNAEYLAEMREIMNKMTSGADDSRSRLLTALKPYMSDGRKKSIDSAVRLLNIARLAGLMIGSQ